MAELAPYIFQQYLLDNGEVNNAGTITAYEAGTVVKKDTFTDAAGGTPNANPFTLATDGRTTFYLESGAYDFVIKDSSGNTLDTKEDVQGGSGSGDNSEQSVATIAALKALVSGSTAYVNVGGYYVNGDGGGGRFYWNSTSSTADNGGTILTPDAAPGTGRWYRVYNEPVDVRWFGAKGDSVLAGSSGTDDYTAISGALAWVNASAGDLYFSRGVYLIGTSFTVAVNSKVIMGQGSAFSSATSKTITFDGLLDCGLQQAFGTNIVASFGEDSIEQAFPEWWGAKADGTVATPETNATDNTTPVQACVDAVGVTKVKFSIGTYLFKGATTVTYRATTSPVGVKLTANTYIEGSGRETIIQSSGTTANGCVPIAADSVDNVGMQNLSIDGNATAQKTDGALTTLAFGVYFWTCTDVSVDNLWISNTSDNTLETILCSRVSYGKTYHFVDRNGTAGGIGGGPQFEDCTEVSVDSVLGDTYDDLVAIIAHSTDITDVSIGTITGTSQNARALFIGQSGSAGTVNRTISDITCMNVNSHDCGTIGETGAFVINNGGIFRNINIKLTDRNSHQSVRITPYDGTNHGQLKNCNFDVTSYNSHTLCVEVNHDDHADTDIENNSLKLICQNPNTDQAVTNPALRILGGDYWDLNVNISYTSTTNEGQSVLLGNTGGTNDTVRYSILRGMINGGNKNVQLRLCDQINLSSLILLNSTEANNTNLEITSEATNTRIGDIRRDGEINDSGTGTTRLPERLKGVYTAVSTSGTGEDTLMTYTLAGEHMSKTGILHIHAAGTITGTTDTKILKFYWGSQSSIVQTATSGQRFDWVLDVYIVEAGTRSDQKVSLRYMQNSTVIYNDYYAGTQSTESDVIIKMTGECANAADGITQESMIIMSL